MIKLYIKTTAAAIFLICFIILVYSLGFIYLEKTSNAPINQLLSKGTLSYIQSVILKTKKEKWNTVLEKIEPIGTTTAKIITIDSLKLSEENKKQLMNKKVIFTSGKDHVFLNYGIVDSIALQRIGDSNYAVQLILGETIDDAINITMRWVVHIISMQLQGVNNENQYAILKNLSQQFGIPIKIIPDNRSLIPEKKQSGFSQAENTNRINTLYFRMPGVPNKILKLGPIKISPVSERFTDMQRYYFPSFITMTLLIVILLTWLFSRNIHKIYQITKRYSIGDFSQKTKVGPLSILHGTYENVISMGNNLKHLIQSQQNMTRFVAHEIRTPLSTMQFAIDAINKKQNLDEDAKQNLASIQEDIQDLNKLVSYFLLYSQTKSHEFKIKPELLPLSPWLEKLIARYQSADKKIILDGPNTKGIIAQFDPSLFRHAIDNLLTNALKFAKHTICVSLEESNKSIYIHIDDDGPGVTKDELKIIFQPFASSTDDQEFGKHIGLGLTITKEIIALHSGAITVDQSPRLCGSRFTIKLPTNE